MHIAFRLYIFFFFALLHRHHHPGEKSGFAPALESPLSPRGRWAERGKRLVATGTQNAGVAQHFDSKAPFSSPFQHKQFFLWR
jgi:hypothetical protein